MKSVLVPVCKTSDDRSSVNYLESDTVWINPNKSVSGSDSGIPHNLSYQDKSSHLYINNICPPEYSELEGRPHYTRNINHCTPSHQVSNALPQYLMIALLLVTSYSRVNIMHPPT